MNTPDPPPGYISFEPTDHWGKVGVAVEDGVISLYLECPNCPEHSGTTPIATFHVGHLRSIADILNRVGDQMGLPASRADKITQRLHREGDDHAIIEEGLKEMRSMMADDPGSNDTAPNRPSSSLWDRKRRSA